MSGLARLRGCRALLVEDESLVAMLAEDILLDAGCEVVVAMTLDDALGTAARARFDFAVLDVNLGQGDSLPVAELLRARSTPYLFATGYGDQGVPVKIRSSAVVVQKPYTAIDLLSGVATVLAQAS